MMRTIARQNQAVLRTTRLELGKLVFVTLEGQVYVRYGPETHAGANIAGAAQREVVATRAVDSHRRRAKGIK